MVILVWKRHTFVCSGSWFGVTVCRRHAHDRMPFYCTRHVRRSE